MLQTPVSLDSPAQTALQYQSTIPISEALTLYVLDMVKLKEHELPIMMMITTTKLNQAHIYCFDDGEL